MTSNNLDKRSYKGLAFSTMATGILILLWIGAMVAFMLSSPAESVSEKLSRLENSAVLYFINYALAILITLFTLFVFSGFSYIINSYNKNAAGINLALTALYGLGNMIAYLSQIILIPFLYYSENVTEEKMLQIGKLLLQDVNYSVVSYINIAAYAVLGIASILSGHYLNKVHSKLKVPAILLALSGLLSLAAFGGTLLKSPEIQSLTLVSGAVYMISMFALSINIRKYNEGL